MVGKGTKILMFVRNIFLIFFSLVIMSTSYGKWVEEPVHLILFSSTAILLLLSLIDCTMLIANVKRKTFYYINAVLQLFLGFFLIILGVGIILIIINIVVIVGLRRSREGSGETEGVDDSTPAPNDEPSIEDPKSNAQP